MLNISLLRSSLPLKNLLSKSSRGDFFIVAISYRNEQNCFITLQMYCALDFSFSAQ